jgi:hypothetical protein
METINSLGMLSFRSNIETYQYNDKYIVLYDDHRYLLNILFEALKIGIFVKTPNLIYFDAHDDACNPKINKKDLLKKWQAKDIKNISSRDFWSFVEFDLSHLDDNWLLAGMEFGLINNSVLIGQYEYDNIQDMNGNFQSSDGQNHELHSIKHLNQCLDSKGCLGDVTKTDMYRNILDIFEYNQPLYYRCFADEVKNPFVLDFDLDCFTTKFNEIRYAWPEEIFKKMYYDNDTVSDFMDRLISRSQFITICREPKCCGGLGESNKILGYLDRYFFNGSLGTLPIR